MIPNELNSQLKAISLFGALPEKSLARLASIATFQRFAANSYLFRSGETPSLVYGISAGGVVLLAQDCREESVVEFMGPGDSLLLPSVFMGQPYTASARTTCPVSAVTLPSLRFLELASSDASLSMQCACALSRHWSILLGQIIEMKTHGASLRLVQFLLGQVPNAHGPAEMTLPGMKKQVAARLGIKPETFSRTLRKLRDFGVEASGDLIRIRSVERLRELVNNSPETIC